MPVFIDREPGHSRSSRTITIGLINNMSDEALKATERQFISLLNSSSGHTPIRLSLYTLPGVPRNGLTASHISGRYSNIEDLWNRRLDGLIVTGREPMTADLADESYWESFTRVVAWAKENCHATVFSCLAAHAAVLHMDGIRRVKRNDKVFGIFECARVSDHPLTAGIGSHFSLPHSRWNGIPEEQLTDCGYKVLTRSPDAGVDTFIKQQKKLFVFFQGHPEYDSDTLLREYRRDLGRYCKGEIQKYPSMPQNYFDRDTMDMLSALQQRAISRQGAEMLTEVFTTLANRTIENSWQLSATSIYGDWLGYLHAQKEKALRSRRLRSMVNAPTVQWAGAGLSTSNEA
jgi:homoserine O-succinyltransferase/O-acetyltransferase